MCVVMHLFTDAGWRAQGMEKKMLLQFFSGFCNSCTRFWSPKASKSFGRGEAANPVSRFYCVCRCAQSLKSVCSLGLHTRETGGPLPRGCGVDKNSRELQERDKRASRKWQRLHLCTVVLANGLRNQAEGPMLEAWGVGLPLVLHE